MLCISAAAAHGDADEPQRFGYPDRRSDGVVTYAVIDEVQFRNRQLAVVVAAVVGQLDLNA